MEGEIVGIRNPIRINGIRGAVAAPPRLESMTGKLPLHRRSSP
jgi:hypothetical protein